MEQHFTILTNAFFWCKILHCGNPEKYSHENCTKGSFLILKWEKIAIFWGGKKINQKPPCLDTKFVEVATIKQDS
jgi:hypothetical protein